MNYYEVFPADARYHASQALTYSYEDDLPRLNLVTIPLRGRMVYGFIDKKVKKPNFVVKPIKAASQDVLPQHCLELARWIADYYFCSLGEALRQFTPGGTVVKSKYLVESDPAEITSLHLDSALTPDQKKAIAAITHSPTSTVLLHGETGSGKTRVYLELAEENLKLGRSSILLVPEIALTSQLALAARQRLNCQVFVLHSQLSTSDRKKIWLQIASHKDACVVLGPRSALFSPLQKPGLIVLDEAHETAYQQEQSPRYRTSRVASQLAKITGAKVVLGTATPLVEDYYLAKSYGAIVRMKALATGKLAKVSQKVVDMREKNNLSTTSYLSKPLLKAMSETLANSKQCLIYLNRRGSARLVMCTDCGWRSLCPRCDLPLVYHGDEHLLRCHTCGHTSTPPHVCPSCGSLNIIYKSAGTKQLAEIISKAYPNHRVERFDSDNAKGSRLHELYQEVRSGKIDILVGTQLLTKGLDLPQLGLVGIVNAEASLNLPDFSAGERTFQLIYQVIGRVGRGHGEGRVVVQTYLPDDLVIKTALDKNYDKFYQFTAKERGQFKFPPFVYMMKVSGSYRSSSAAESAGKKLVEKLRQVAPSVDISDPTPSFYSKRAGKFYWQIVIKAKQRKHLLELATLAGGKWTIELDPIDLF